MIHRTLRRIGIIALGCFVLIAAYAVWLFATKKTDGGPNHLANAGQNPPVRVVLTVADTGGLCVYGGCNSTTTLYSTGAYRVTRQEYADANGEPTERVLDTGTLTGTETTRIIELIANTDFAALRNQPFTDTCPTAYDGMERTYTFVYADRTEEMLSTCQYVLDPTHPLMLETHALLSLE